MGNIYFRKYFIFSATRDGSNPIKIISLHLKCHTNLWLVMNYFDSNSKKSNLFFYQEDIQYWNTSQNNLH